MRIIRQIIFAGLLAAVPFAANAQSGDLNAKACNNKSGVEAIADCTAVIESLRYSGAMLAVVFNNRGRAYNNQKDYARAIADFDEAIRLDPQFAQAFVRRGGAYYFKKDYAHGIADFDEAIGFVA